MINKSRLFSREQIPIIPANMLIQVEKKKKKKGNILGNTNEAGES